ncbi:protein misato homolog 1-like [Diadema setosum]|uniref:protein misato homolog 1-like n=1 Tax=Diadema setosum TaxID=31175 RepID=UPI003B3A1F17
MDGKTREIVTLQCGHYANFVGTHFWNIQESTFSYDPNPAQLVPKDINNDVLFREGRTLQGEVTYTPRLVCVDLKGSLNTLRAEGILYDLKAEEDVHWGGDVTLHKSSPAHKNQFLADLEAQDEMFEHGECRPPTHGNDLLTPDNDSTEADTESEEHKGAKSVAQKSYNLNEEVAVWSDYLYGHLHPRTISIVKEYMHNSTIGQFDLYTQGKELLSRRDISNDIEDRLHFFVEECDHLQGFQVYLDFYNGFSGLGCGVLEGLADDYHGKGILTAGVAPTCFDDSNPLLDSYRVINSVLSFSRLVAHSSMFVPLSLASTLWRKVGSPVTFPHLEYKPSLHYHTSAVLACAMDTATLPLRATEGAVSLSMMTDAIAARGRKIGSLCTSLPLPLHHQSTLADMLSASPLPWQPVSPHHGMDLVDPFAQSVVLRGVPQNRLKRPPAANLNPYHSCHDEEEMLRNHLIANYPRTLSSGRCINPPCKTGAPFPHIFDSKVSREGQLMDEHRKEEQGVESIPMVTSLQSSPAARHLLSSLVSEAGRLDIHKFHGYTEEGLEEDEFKEHVQELEQLLGCYETETDRQLAQDNLDDDDDV